MFYYIIFDGITPTHLRIANVQILPTGGVSRVPTMSSYWAERERLHRSARHSVVVVVVILV